MLDLIEYLLTFATGPIALVRRAPVCPGGPDWIDRAWTIELEQLTDSETDVLVAALGVEDAALRAQIAATADGNPFFAEQLAAAVVETQGTSSLADVQLLASINALLEARLDGPGTPSAGHSSAVVVAGVLAARGMIRDQRRSPVSRELAPLAGAQGTDPGDTVTAPGRGHVPLSPRAHPRCGLRRDAEDGARSAPRTVRRLAGLSGAARAAQDEIRGYHLEQAYLNRVALAPPDAAARRVGADAATHLLAAGARAFAREDMSAAAGLLGRAAALLPTGDTRRLDAIREQVQALWEAGRPYEADTALERLLAKRRPRAKNVSSRWVASSASCTSS